MDTTFKEVGNRIRQARKEKGLSQADLADKLSISNSHISDIENGKTNIGLDIFMRITETLQVSADWLLLNDTPHANAILDNEVVKLLDGCSTAEKQSIIKMISEFKNALHNKKE